MKTVGIIPARYQSTRFPGKPLAPILGKSLIQRTYDNAKRAASLDELIVATDDARIYTHVLEFGGKALYTSAHCHTGSDRVAEAAQNYPDADLIVNIQGDEPCLNPTTIDQAVAALHRDPDAVVSTAVTSLNPDLDPGEAALTSVVKCVFDRQGRALYFSRALIPSGKEGGCRTGVAYYRHLGLYVYRRDFLLSFAALPATPLMLAEDLEQLKVLEHGFKIHVVETSSSSPGVDYPEDIKKVEKHLCQNMYL